MVAECVKGEIIMFAYEGSEPFVFVSYSHKDKSKVLPIIEGLQRRNFRVWYDEGIEVGFDWTESIAKHLNRSSCVLAFVSRNFDASHNCRREINFAIKKRKEPMVIYLEDEELLSDGMQMQLCPLHAIYLDNYANNESFLDVLSKAALLQPCLCKIAAPAKPAQTTAEQRRQAASVERKKEIIRSALSSAAEQKYGKGGAEATAKPPEPSVEELYEQADSHYWRKEYADAVRLFRKAAEQGYAPAQWKLGLCYDLGEGVAKNKEEAIRWYRKAADQGYANAQYNLGVCYQYGVGVQNNIAEARKWFQKAADQGDKDAKKKLEGL